VCVCVNMITFELLEISSWSIYGNKIRYG